MILYNLRKNTCLFKENQKERPFQAITLKYELQDMKDETSINYFKPLLLSVHEYPICSESIQDV